MTSGLLFDAATLLPPQSTRQSLLGQYFTPPWLAMEVARIADVEGLTVLEPSAGDGAIVAACLELGAAQVIACEIDPRMVGRLQRRFAGQPVTILSGDFLTMPLHLFTAVDVIAGNPPYDGGMDSDHLAKIADVLEAINDPNELPRASLLLRTVALHSQERYQRVWQRLAVTALYPCAERIAFEIDGSIGEAGKIDVSVFRVELGSSATCRHLRAPV
jgi:predicted RNA methylase